MRQIKEFVGLLGRTRFIMLAVLLMLNGALWAGWQKWYVPRHDTLVSEKATVDATRNRLNQEIAELPQRYELLKKNDDRYEALEKKGLFDVQDRIEARARIDRLRTEAGLRGIDYSISPQEKVDLPEGNMLQGILVRSNIDISLKGLTDLEMRDFIRKMNQEFNALVVTQTLELSLGQKLDEAALLELSQKRPVDFVNGKVAFQWYSILPKPVDPNAAQNEAFGGVAP